MVVIESFRYYHRRKKCAIFEEQVGALVKEAREFVRVECCRQLLLWYYCSKKICLDKFIMILGSRAIFK